MQWWHRQRVCIKVRILPSRATAGGAEEKGSDSGEEVSDGIALGNQVRFPGPDVGRQSHLKVGNVDDGSVLPSGGDSGFIYKSREVRADESRSQFRDGTKDCLCRRQEKKRKKRTSLDGPLGSTVRCLA